jgi:catechol 2,3-dioxygenase-like lactoylglutathione lyase family enzyme
VSHPGLHGPFHTGIVVDDLAEAMATYGTAFGLEWALPKHSTHPLRTERGLLPRDTWVTFSLEGPHHLELLEHADSTAYDHLPGAPRINHLGYWSDDLPVEIARLEAAGLRCRLHGESPDGWLSRFAYLEDPQSSMFVELVDAELRDEFNAWWSGTGEPPPSAPGRSFPERGLLGGDTSA